MQKIRRLRDRPILDRHNRRATACVECALILPVLVIFVLGLLEMGRFIEVRQILTSAAEEGARQASAGQVTNAQVVNIVTGCIAAAGLPTTGLTITVADLTNPGRDVSQATCMDNLQVTVTIPFVNVRWCSSLLVSGGARRLAKTQTTPRSPDT